MKMNIDQMARELREDLSAHLDKKVSISATKEAIGCIFTYMSESLADGSELNIPGFGIFKVKSTPERDVRNPRSGEMVTVAAKRVVKFSPAKTLKDKVNQG